MFVYKGGEFRFLKSLGLERKVVNVIEKCIFYKDGVYRNGKIIFDYEMFIFRSKRSEIFYFDLSRWLLSEIVFGLLYFFMNYYGLSVVSFSFLLYFLVGIYESDFISDTFWLFLFRVFGVRFIYEVID